MLCTLRKIDLQQLAAHLPSQKSASKMQLVEALMTAPATAGEGFLLEQKNYLVRLQGPLVDFLLFLYFGKTFEDLKSFALRDLGVIRVAGETEISLRFESAAEAKSCFEYSRWQNALRHAGRADHEQAKEFLLADIDPPSAYAKGLRAGLVEKAGRFFEREKDFAAAVELYKLADSPETQGAACPASITRRAHLRTHGPCSKVLSTTRKRMRNLFSPKIFTGENITVTKSATALSSCATAPLSTLMKHTATCRNTAPHPSSGGRAGKSSRQKIYYGAVFLGLLLWDEVFEAPGALPSAFDRLPRCLKDKTFYAKHQCAIDAKLNAVRRGAGLTEILKTIATRWETSNGLFAWRHVDIDALQALFARASPAAIADIVALMAADFDMMSNGFPDLMLVNDRAVRFVEIKAEGDALRRHQLTRLRQLQRCGVSSEICRVGYRYDPHQTYVVIDIETTGGFGNAHRITEVAAVKVRNHQVIDEWQSLINPERRIPANITLLTGITDAMVANAPLFRHIAGDLEAFTNDAVFVAHNVNFDYGFISAEYQRLEQNYRRPKFCTVANMRRHFPGLRSYSLGNLCQEYGIRLDQHHRALHDARATATLLNMINSRRETNTTPALSQASVA